MTFPCYGCGQQIQYGDTKKDLRNEDMSVHNCDKHLRNKSNVGPASSTTTNYSSNTQYRARDPSARDESIKKMQEQKQAHELKLMESAEKNAQLIAESNKAIAEAVNSLAISMHKLSESTYNLSQATRLEHHTKKVDK